MRFDFTHGGKTYYQFTAEELLAEGLPEQALRKAEKDAIAAAAHRQKKISELIGSA